MGKNLQVLFNKYDSEENILRKCWLSLLIKLEKLIVVSWRWHVKRYFFSINKSGVRVGLGPLVERENTLGFRKWGIDPIIDGVNRSNTRYIADWFYGDEDLEKFDILVIVKNFDTIKKSKLEKVKASDKILIYNPRDNPYGCTKNYLENEWLLKLSDGIITSSPQQNHKFSNYCSNVAQIETPIINNKHITNYSRKGVMTLIWQGFLTNAEYMELLHPIIKKINSDSNVKTILLYHCDRKPHFVDGDTFRFIQWKISNWQTQLTKADIGVVIKPVNNESQQEKPPTKILSYMAAGLPVVCTPSAADKQVIEHGKNGFFAYNNQDWYEYIKALIEDRDLRENIGKAAHKSALDNFNIQAISKKYTDFFDTTLAKESHNCKS